MVMSAFRSHGWVYSTHRGCRADQRPNRPATRTVALAVGRDVIAGGGDPRWDRRGRDRSRGLGGHAGREGLDVLGAQRLSAHAPVAACDLLDDDPGHRAHVLALDRDHRVGEALDDLALLVGREDVLDELDIDDWHDAFWWLDCSPRAQAGGAISGCAGSSSWSRRASSAAIEFRVRNSAIAWATGSGRWICRRWPTLSIVRSSTWGSEERRNSAISSHSGWVFAPITDRTGVRMAAACSGPNVHSVRAGSSTPKKVSTSLIDCVTTPGIRSSSNARHSSQSRPLAADANMANAPEWSPLPYASNTGPAAFKNAPPSGNDTSVGSSRA